MTRDVSRLLRQIVSSPPQRLPYLMELLVIVVLVLLALYFLAV